MNEVFLHVGGVKLGQEAAVMGVEVSRGGSRKGGRGLQQFPEGGRAVDAKILQFGQVGFARFAQSVTVVAAGLDGLGGTSTIGPTDGVEVVLGLAAVWVEPWAQCLGVLVGVDGSASRALAGV